MAKKRKKYSLKSKLFLCILSFFASLMAMEIIVRLMNIAPDIRGIDIYGLDSSYQFSNNKILGYEIKPNIFYEDKKGNQVRFSNSHGMRDQERKLEKSPGVCRIMLLGDSVVQGEEHYKETIAYYLETYLQKNFYKNTEVLNFGVEGYATAAEVELLFVKGIKFKPDIVVQISVVNDFEGNNQMFIHKTNWDEVGPLSIGSLVSNHAFFWLFLHFESVRYFTITYRNSIVKKHYSTLKQNKHSVTQAFAKLAHLRNQHKFQLATILWPHYQNLNQHHFKMEKNIKNIHTQFKKITAKFNIATYDITFAFKQCNKNQKPVKSYFFDGMHPSAKGAEIAAYAIQKILKQHGFLDNWKKK